MKTVCHIFLLLSVLLNASAADRVEVALQQAVSVNSQLRLLSEERLHLKALVHAGFVEYYQYQDRAREKAEKDKEILEQHKKLELAKVADLYSSNLISRTERAKRELNIVQQYQVFDKNRLRRQGAEDLKILNIAINTNQIAAIETIERRLDDLTMSNYSNYLILDFGGKTNEAANVLACNILTDYKLLTRGEMKGQQSLAKETTR